MTLLASSLKTAFQMIADILEISEESVFKIRAYRNGAEIVGGLSADILENFSTKELQKLQGIGEALAEKIIEYRETGKIEFLEKLKKGFPNGLLELLQIPGLGPKTLRILWFEYQVKNFRDLEKLLASGKLAEHFNFGPRKVENLQNGIAFWKEHAERIPYVEAKAIADEIVQDLKKCPEALQVEIAGELTKKKETIGDIDILVSSTSPEPIIEAFVKLPLVAQVNAKGETKASIFTKGNRQVDLRVVPPESFGAAWQYFTGSKEHNILLRRLAQKRGLLLSEYGVFRGRKKLAGKTEVEVYEVLGEKWIEPERR